MEEYKCTICNWVYNPIEYNNVKFEDQPDDFVCPLCGAGKDEFEKIQ